MPRHPRGLHKISIRLSGEQIQFLDEQAEARMKAGHISSRSHEVGICICARMIEKMPKEDRDALYARLGRNADADKR